MDVDEIQTHPCKFTKVSRRNVGNNVVVAAAVVEQQCRDEDDEIRKDGIVVPRSNKTVASLCGWHHSSRIYRVSRASGGKDRHSKVLTSKGLRDRRVRLSVSTAIVFYDLQVRLGYDQPSKAIEWLIKAAEEAIAELPSLSCAFPDTPPKLLADGNRAEHSVEMELNDDYLNNQHHKQQQQLSLSKSACSSNSETSKGSGLSLYRPDIRVSRVKARERARERAVKDKEKDEEREINQYDGENHNAQNSSLTELLTTGISGVSNNNTSTGSGSAQQTPHGEGRQWSLSAPMDYFTPELFEPWRTHHHSSLGVLNQIQPGNSSLSQSMIIPPFTHHSAEQHHFSFMPEHLQSQRGGVENYILNFTMSSSSGLAGLNRGTLQSNSVVPSLCPHLQRFSPTDGSSNAPFFIGATATPSAVAALENNNHHNHYHQFASGFDGLLQLYHGDGTRFSNNDGKRKH